MAELRERIAKAIARRYCTEESSLVRFNQSLPEARENADAAIKEAAKWVRERPRKKLDSRLPTLTELADEMEGKL